MIILRLVEFHNQRFILPTLYRLKISKLIRLQSIEEANINSLPLLDSSRTTIRSPSISLSLSRGHFEISQFRRIERGIGGREGSVNDDEDPITLVISGIKVCRPIFVVQFIDLA